jgi:hypothetical protein
MDTYVEAHRLTVAALSREEVGSEVIRDGDERVREMGRYKNGVELDRRDMADDSRYDS